MSAKKIGATSNVISEDSTGNIHAVIAGLQNTETITKLALDITVLVTNPKNPVARNTLLLELASPRVNDNNKEIRAAGKSIMQLPLARIAIVGPRWSKYIILASARASSSNVETAYFTNISKAKAWLNNDERKLKRAPDRRSPLATLAFVVLMFVVAQLVILSTGAYLYKRIQANSKASFDSRFLAAKNEVTTNLSNYEDALYGFKAFFGSSGYVDEGEFNSYYDDVRLAERYPGFAAISFISQIDEKDLPSFITTHRKDSSKFKGGHPDFKIIEKAPVNTHYIVTYIALLKNPTLGRDFAADKVRLETYGNARSTGAPRASSTLVFKTFPKNEQQGFLISMPVKTKDGSQLGFVNAVFSYHKFFSNVFARNDGLLDDVEVIIKDDTGTTLTNLGEKNITNKDLTRTAAINVAGRNWTVSLNAGKSFGASLVERYSPALLIALTELVVIALLIAFYFQDRANRNIYKVADLLTEDLRYERNLAVANQKRESAIIASLGDGFVIIDDEERIVQMNEIGLRMIGFTANEVLGKDYAEIIRAQDMKGHLAVRKDRPATKAVRQGTITSGELKYQRKDNTFFPVKIIASPIIVDYKTIGAIILFRDATKEYELDEAKSEFVSLASHQLRTPLASIGWYTEMLLKGDAGKVSKTQKNYLDEVYTANQRMVKLINSLLNVSRIELDTFSIESEKLDIQKATKQVMVEVKTLTDARKQKLSIDFAKSLPVISFDKRYLEMIFQNLLSNASKYTPTGGEVRVSVTALFKERRYHGKQFTKNGILIEVTDSGYGIPKDAQDKIFTKMYRADNAKAKDADGTGLGLYVIKKVIDYSNGEIWFTSKQDKGTSFYVYLPLKVANKQGAKRVS